MGHVVSGSFVKDAKKYVNMAHFSYLILKKIGPSYMDQPVLHFLYFWDFVTVMTTMEKMGQVTCCDLKKTSNFYKT